MAVRFLSHELENDALFPKKLTVFDSFNYRECLMIRSTILFVGFSVKDGRPKCSSTLLGCDGKRRVLGVPLWKVGGPTFFNIVEVDVKGQSTHTRRSLELEINVVVVSLVCTEGGVGKKGALVRTCLIANLHSRVVNRERTELTLLISQ